MNKKKIILLISILLIASVIKLNIDAILYLKSKYILWAIGTFIIAFYAICVNKSRLIAVKIQDICVAFLVFFGVINFYLTDTISIYHTTVWYYIAYVYTYIILRLMIKNKEVIPFVFKNVLFVIVFLAFINAVLGILQYFGYLESTSKYFKVVGLFSSPNYLGLLISLGILSLIVLNKLLRFGKWIKLTLGATIVFFLCLLLVTKSRGAFLGLLLATLYLFWDWVKIKKKLGNINRSYVFSLLLVILTVSIWGVIKLFQQNPNSIYGRYFILKTAVAQIVNNPWGYGIGSFSKQYNLYKAQYFSTPRDWYEIQNADFVFSAFNDYLELTFEMGVIWMLVFGMFLFLVFRNLRHSFETKSATAILLLLAFFASTNILYLLPIFVLIGLFCIQLIIQNNEGFIIFGFKNNLFLKMIFSVPAIIILIVIGLRLNAEISFYHLSNSIENSPEIVNKKIKYIDAGGKAYLYAAKLFKEQNQKELAIRYLDTAFEISAMPKVGRSLGLELVQKHDIAKAIEIFKYNRRVEPYRFEARMDLLNTYFKNEDVNNAVKIAEEIKNLPVKIPSKRVEIYKNQALKVIKNSIKDSLYINLKGNLSATKVYKSEALNAILTYRLYIPNLKKIHHKLPLVVFNDGFSYIDKGRIIYKIDSLIENKIIKPFIGVFINPVDLSKPKVKRKTTRQNFYLCNDNYNAFITKEMIPFLEYNYPVSSENRSVFGISFGGLSAAYLAIKNPNVFENVILQSPAFHPRKQIYSLYNSFFKPNINVYLSYGTGKDTEKQCLPFIQILKNKNYNFKVERVEGGNHTWGVWEAQLNSVFIRYYGL